MQESAIYNPYITIKVFLIPVQSETHHWNWQRFLKQNMIEQNFASKVKKPSLIKVCTYLKKQVFSNHHIVLIDVEFIAAVSISTKNCRNSFLSDSSTRCAAEAYW